MTPEQRELAVELLRCAADRVITGRGAFVAASLELECQADVENIAHCAWIVVEWELRDCVEGCVRDYVEGQAWFKHEAMLEAALRLEEGWDVDPE